MAVSFSFRKLIRTFALQNPEEKSTVLCFEKKKTVGLIKKPVQ